MAWHDYECPSCGPVTNDKAECPDCGAAFTSANIRWLKAPAIGGRALDDRMKQKMNTSSMVKKTDVLLEKVLTEQGRTNIPKKVQSTTRAGWGGEADKMIAAQGGPKPTGDALKDLAALQQKGILGSTSGVMADPRGRGPMADAGAERILSNAKTVFAPPRPSEIHAASKDDLTVRNK